MTRAAARTAMVTGGGSGIGAATVAALAADDCAVAVVDIDAAAAERVAKETGGDARAYTADVANRAEVDRTLERITADFGGLDILVNNAGIGTVSTLEAMPIEDWTRVIEVNLGGPFHCLQAAIPALKAGGGGAVVNVASIAGKRISYHGGANYTAAKSGLLGLTRHAAFELALYGIRVNAVCPGPVLTPMVEAATSEAERQGTAQLVPLGRWIRPEDVADMIVFLSGPASAMCTGASFDVDGGFMVSNGTPYRDYMARRNADFGGG
ncbi:MAG: SDR family NAD(P)-dependent oxidoreductase [Alphaproteobacteria bacterium]|jgi:NAD(P)-dependent dehydrogenase (short-subunit alcohol dehydrogenase family)|nr:SDR family NAD(P)-dependent oxidoreductase [Alphaproteobacteria bacterium]MDP6812130.1 SDR family NAD(P)-dependent oxidoreductase [Alphaproteobacteria bacterium]